MSNSLVPANINIPAHLMAHVGKPSLLSSSVMGGLGGGEAFPRISIKGSRFRIVEGGAEQVLDTLALEVIIVGANPKLSKTWYAGAWSADQEANKAPDCFSLDGIRPNPEASSKQAEACAACPQNAWGSKVTDGKELKACADQKRLAIVAADDPDGPVYLLQVTPAALRGLNTYQKELSMRGIPAEIVRTKLTFDTTASFPKLLFSFAGFIDEPTQKVVNGLFGSPQVIAVTGEGNSVQEVPQPQAPAPVQRPAPVVVSPPPPPPAPPPPPPPAAEPKRGFGRAAAAPAAPAPVAAASVATRTAPAPATTVVDGASLADEIANLVNGLGIDDA